MSVVKQNRLWNNIPVRIETNILTGAVEVYNGNAELFSSDGGSNDWKVNRQVLANVWNSNNTRKELPEDIEATFYRGEYQIFNNDRAAAINNSDNYTGVSQAVRTQKALAEQGVPDVINPVTGTQNNSEGVSTNSVDNTADDQSTETLFDVLGNIPEITVDHSTDVYRYPLGVLPNLGYDFIEIRAYEYDAGTLRSSGTNKSSPRETFILPMQPTLEETSSTSWGDDTMNFIQEAAANVAGGVLAGASNNDLRGFFSNMVDVSKKQLDAILSNPDMKQGIIAYFAGQASKTNFAARAQGAVINSNLELLFKGPTLRTFQFSFKLRPRNPDEAAVIRNMIRAFKKNMNPRRSAGNIFLKTPSVFTLKYTRNGSDHPFMNKIGDCALQNFKVNYTPDGNYMTYDDGSMTGYDISLGFSELFSYRRRAERGAL